MILALAAVATAWGGLPGQPLARRAVDAYAHHETRLADFYRKRFRGEFRPAVAAWVATRPLRDANAPPGWRPAYPDYLYLAYTNATAPAR